MSRSIPRHSIGAEHNHQRNSITPAKSIASQDDNSCLSRSSRFCSLMSTVAWCDTSTENNVEEETEETTEYAEEVAVEAVMSDA